MTFDRVRQDVRYALRTLVRAPGFTLLAISTIAVGVGANAAIFSVVNAVLLRPLPFANAGELFLLHQTNTQTRQSSGNASPADILDWRARTKTFAGIAAFRDEAYVLGGDRPERIGGANVSANFFDVLGVAPALGRAFTADDEQRGNRAVVLSDGLWRERFGADPSAVGRTIRLNSEVHTIVGVMPPGVDYPDEARLWTPPHWRMPDDPLQPAEDPSTQRGHAYMFVVGRLKPGVTRAIADADLGAVAAQLEREYPTTNMNVGATLLPLRDDLVADVRPTLVLLFAAVGVLLLIAAANVSALLIARATARTQEIAMRLALGASRARIVGQLLTESTLLAVIGGTCGILLAMWLVPALVTISPRDLGVTNVPIDASVLGFSLAVSLASGVLFGLAPARQTFGINLHDDLKQSARQGTSPRQRGVRSMLVAAEVALSMVLLVGAGLTIRSFVRLQHVPTGFDVDREVTFSVSLPQTRYPTPRQKGEFWERAVSALRAVPGVDTVGATSRLPLSGGNSSRGIVVDGRTDLATQPTVDYRTASPDYFRALGIPLVRGRAFLDSDREDRPLVAAVSSSMAQRLWPGADPIGHHIAIDPEKPMTVVAVVGDVHHTSLETSAQPTFYVPYRQDPWPSMTFVLRMKHADSGAAQPLSAGLQTAVREAVSQIDKEQPVGAIRSMDQQLSRSLSRRRFSVTLLTAFGIVAVALAGIGLYGVLAFIVAQRRREIGVRMALGARPFDVVSGVLGEGVRLAAIGIGVGFVLALAGTRLLTTLLFGTSPTDALTFASAGALLVAIAATASLVPAVRASRVDPLVALRDE
jgi:putative ABC transport system permease protein